MGPEFLRLWPGFSCGSQVRLHLDCLDGWSCLPGHFLILECVGGPMSFCTGSHALIKVASHTSVGMLLRIICCQIIPVLASDKIGKVWRKGKQNNNHKQQNKLVGPIESSEDLRGHNLSGSDANSLAPWNDSFGSGDPGKHSSVCFLQMILVFIIPTSID